MKLVAFVAREGLALPGLRAGNMSTFEIGKGPYGEWKVHLRGPALVLESPPGFNGAPADVRTVYEVSRATVHLKWNLEPGDKIADLANYTHPEPAPVKPVAMPATPATSTSTKPVFVAGKPVAPPAPVVDTPAAPRSAMLRAAATDDDIEEDDGDGDSLPSSGPKRAH